MNSGASLPGRPLTPAQRRVLIALVDACPTLGQELSSKTVADAAEMAGGATTLALRGLERRQLVVSHGFDEDCWSPTLPGRARARELSDRAARLAPVDQAAELPDLPERPEA